MLRRSFLLLFVAALVLSGCSSIEIGEDELFQNKPTVTPADFCTKSRAKGCEAGLTLDERTVAAADGTPLDAWYFTQPGARGTVLYFGGNGFFLVHSKEYIEAITRYPVDLFMVDYRGYGKSGGTPTVEGLRRDALAVFDYVVDSTDARARATVVHGHSMGTFMAARVGQKRRTAGIILQNPATTAEEWADDLTPWYLDLFVTLTPSAPLKKVSNLKQVAGIEEPLLVIGAAQDPITDPEMARRLYEAAPSEQKQLAVIDSVGHNIPYDNAAYRRALAGFLEDVLPGSLTGAAGVKTKRDAADE